MIKKYKRKSDFVEAVQWTGENKEEIEAFIGKECKVIIGGALMPKEESDADYIFLFPKFYAVKKNNDIFLARSPEYIAKMYESYDSILDIVKVEYKVLKSTVRRRL